MPARNQAKNLRSIVDVRALARKHNVLAVNTLAGICRMSKNDTARVSAAQALIHIGYGKAIDRDERHEIKVVIRQLSQPDEEPVKLIEHEPIEVDQAS